MSEIDWSLLPDADEVDGDLGLGGLPDADDGLRRSWALSRDRDPAKTAHAAKIASQARKPVALVEQEPSVEFDERFKEINQILEQAPAIRSALRDPMMMAQAKDDVESLSRAEIALRNRAYEDEVPLQQRVLDRIREGWEGLKSAASTVARLPSIERGAQASQSGDYIVAYDPGGNPIWASQAYVGEGQLERVTEAAVDVGQAQTVGLARAAAAHREAMAGIKTRPATEAMMQAEGVGEMWDAFLVDPLGIMADIGISSGVQQAPALAATIVTRNPVLAMAAAGGNSYALELGHGVLGYLGQNGVDAGDAEAVYAALQDPAVVRRAVDHATIRGTVVGSLDLLSAGAASKMLLPGALVKNTAVKEALNTFVAQPTLQGFLGAVGEGGAQLATEGEISSPGEVFAEAIGEFSQAPIEAVALGYDRYRRTVADAQRLDEVTRSAVDSKLRKANPEAYRALVDAMPGDSVYLDPRAANVFFQTDLTPEMLEMPAIQRLMDEVQPAIDEGRDIEIPLSEYMTDLAGTPFQEAMQKHMRLDADVLTPAELADADIQAEIARIQEMDAEQRENELLFYNDVMGQMVGLGEDRGVAEQGAIVHEAFFSTLAKSSGTSPQELHQKFGVTINREIDPRLRSKLRKVDNLDILIDKLRAGEVPTDSDLFGESLVEFVARNGGIVDNSGELAAMDADMGRVGSNRIARTDGRDADYMAELLQEHGYLSERDPNLMLDEIRRELAGEKVYASGSENAELMGLRDQMEMLSQAVDQAGIDIQTASNQEIRSALGEPSQQALRQAGQLEKRRDVVQSLLDCLKGSS